MRTVLYTVLLALAAAAGPSDAAPHGFVFAGVCDGSTWAASNFEGMPTCKDGPTTASVKALRGLKVHAALPASGRFAAEVARVHANQRVKLIALHRLVGANPTAGPKIVWAEIATPTTDFGQFEPTP